jgi:1-acyl-sn-glycerol-3-phosphate acyltransferase
MSANWQQARRLRGFDPCFTLYLRALVRSNFSRVWSSGSSALPPAGGYIAAANHHSWWDGLIPYLLHRSAKRRRPFALMMSETELRRFPYFRFGGAFSIDASSVRASRESICYAGAQARDGAAVWIYPEGELRAPGTELHFTSGFVHAAREGGVPVVPVAMRFAMLQRQRPEAFVRFGEPLAPGRGAVSASEAHVERMLGEIDRAIETQRIESEFSCMLAGKSGVDDRLALAAR